MADYNQTPFRAYDFQTANKHYAQTQFPEANPIAGSGSRAVIVTCCDPRCSPEHFFKLKEQEATVIRNVGGRAADPGVIRTILLLSSLISTSNNAISEVLVVHHTDCMASKISNKSIRQLVATGTSYAPWKAGAKSHADALVFLSFPEADTERNMLERSVGEDVAFLWTHPLWKAATPVSGWIYDVSTGQAEEICRRSM